MIVLRKTEAALLFTKKERERGRERERVKKKT